MFSGIIEEKAQVKTIAKTSEGCKLTVVSLVASEGTRAGDSISVNGACLTVVEAKDRYVSFDIMKETLERTNLTDVAVEEKVNLERSLKVGDRISGHFVTGHVDCLGRISAIIKEPNNYALDIEFPAEKAAYVAEKGSIAIDGVSLTIAEIKDNHIKVCLIPLTLKTTNLASKKVGNLVNIEFDMLGKYLLKKVTPSKSKIDENFLKEHGFF